MAKKLFKALSLVLSSLMMIGAGIGIKGGIEKAKAESNTVSWTASSNCFGSAISSVNGTAKGTLKTGDYTWNYERTLVALGSGKTDYVSMSSGYMAFGSGNASNKLVITTDEIPGKITSVMVDCFGDQHTLNITVGDSSYYSAAAPASSAKASVGKASGGEASGPITISFLPSSTKKQAGIKSITVSYDDSPIGETVNVASVSVSPKTAQLGVGDTTTLSASVLPNNATDKTVTWSSDNENVATVSDSGVVSAVAIGTANITVRTNDQGKTDTCAVTVAAASPKYTWNVDSYCDDNGYASTASSELAVGGVPFVINDNINFTGTTASGKTNTRFYNSNGTQTLRVYAGGTISFSSNLYNFKKLTFNNTVSFSANCGTLSGAVWTAPNAETNSVTFTAGSTVTISSIIFEYTERVLTSYTVSFDANGGTFASGKGTSSEFAIGSEHDVTMPLASDLTATPDKYTTLKGWSYDDTLYNPGATVHVTTFATFVAVYEVPETITLAQANELAPTGTSYKFTSIGEVSSIADTKNFTITDGVNSINVYHYDEISGLYAGIHQRVKVTGVLSQYNSKNQFAGAEVVILDVVCTVSFDVNGGEGTYDAQKVFSGQKVTKPTTDPTKSGFTFGGWYNGEVEWNFNDTVTSNLTLTAHWNALGGTDTFEALDTKSNLKFTYSNSGSGEILDDSFVCTSSGSKAVPDGWTINVDKGSYSSPYYQSFRTGGEYVLSPVFDAVNSVSIDFTFYLNNTGTSGNKASYIVFEGLNTSGEIIAVSRSENLNNRKTGADNVETINASLSGNGIIQLKVSFVKDGGGNIAFSNIKISEVAYSCDNVSMQFGTFIDEDSYNDIIGLDANAEFGMFYAPASILGTDSFKEMLADSLSSAAPADLEDDDIYHVDCEPAKLSDNSYQFGVSINNIPNTDFDFEVVSIAYVLVNGTYYFNNEVIHSVNSLANAYVNAEDTSSYSDHIGALIWLSTYVAD